MYFIGKRASHVLILQNNKLHLTLINWDNSSENFTTNFISRVNNGKNYYIYKNILAFDLLSRIIHLSQIITYTQIVCSQILCIYIHWHVFIICLIFDINLSIKLLKASIYYRSICMIYTSNINGHFQMTATKKKKKKMTTKKKIKRKLGLLSWFVAVSENGSLLPTYLY